MLSQAGCCAFAIVLGKSIERVGTIGSSPRLLLRPEKAWEDLDERDHLFDRTDRRDNGDFIVSRTALARRQGGSHGGESTGYSRNGLHVDRYSMELHNRRRHLRIRPSISAARFRRSSWR